MAYSDDKRTDPNPDTPTAVNLDGEKGIKTLGVALNLQSDVLSFTVKEANIE